MNVPCAECRLLGDFISIQTHGIIIVIIVYKVSHSIEAHLCHVNCGVRERQTGNEQQSNERQTETALRQRYSCWLYRIYFECIWAVAVSRINTLNYFQRVRSVEERVCVQMRQPIYNVGLVKVLLVNSNQQVPFFNSPTHATDSKWLVSFPFSTELILRSAVAISGDFSPSAEFVYSEWNLNRTKN